MALFAGKTILELCNNLSASQFHFIQRKMGVHPTLTTCGQMFFSSPSAGPAAPGQVRAARTWGRKCCLAQLICQPGLQHSQRGQRWHSRQGRRGQRQQSGEREEKAAYAPNMYQETYLIIARHRWYETVAYRMKTLA